MNDSGSWPTLALSDVATAITSGATPQSGSARYYTTEGGVPFAKIDDLTASSGQYIDSTTLHVTDMALRETALKTYPVGTILLSMYGTVGLVKITARTICANQALAALIPPFRCDPKYLYHVLLWSRQGWERFKAQTTQANINGAVVKAFHIPSPTLVQQQRIAEILDTLDEQIRKTEHILGKLKLVRQGLLNSLLTRGIDEHGRLRDPVRHPQQFTDTPIGRLPKQWDTSSISDLVADVEPAMRSGPFGSALLKHELVSSGVPLLGIDNIHVDDFRAEFTRFVTHQKARELSRYRVHPGDVMITIMGTVGRSCLVPENVPHALSSKHVWTMTFDQRRYLPYLVSAQLNHAEWVLAQLRRDEQGGIMNAIRSDTLREAILPVPPIEEQHRIRAVLESQDRRIVREKEELDKLRFLKEGLASDLLSGRVRVPMEVKA